MGCRSDSSPATAGEPSSEIQAPHIVFALVGSGLVAGGLVSFRNTSAFLETAVVVDGEVTEVREIRRSGGPVYKPVVRYVDHHGTQRDYIAGFAANPPAYFAGERVELLYDPKDPKYPLNIRINDRFGLWSTAVGLTGFGLFFLLVVAATWFLYAKGGEYPVGDNPPNPMDGFGF